jgi:hypothetical protein
MWVTKLIDVEAKNPTFIQLIKTLPKPTQEIIHDPIKSLKRSSTDVGKHVEIYYGLYAKQRFGVEFNQSEPSDPVISREELHPAAWFDTERFRSPFQLDLRIAIEDKLVGRIDCLCAGEVIDYKCYGKWGGGSKAFAQMYCYAGMLLILSGTTITKLTMYNPLHGEVHSVECDPKPMSEWLRDNYIQKYQEMSSQTISEEKVMESVQQSLGFLQWFGEKLCEMVKRPKCFVVVGSSIGPGGDM